MKDTKHVKGGVLVATSPSAIEAFDESTPFGCARRFHFESVQGLRGPETGSQRLGTALHARIEHHLGHRDRPEPSADVERLFMAVRPIVDDVKNEGVLAVEEMMKLELAGVVVNGRIDVVTKTGILDWKTTSDFSRYSKTPGQLQTSTQMLLYAKWLRGDSADPTTLEHVYVQTKGKTIAERVRAKVDKKMLDKGVERVIEIIEEMKVAAGEVDVSKLKPDLTKCSRCPHLAYCPKENKTMASLLSRFKEIDATPNSDTLPEAKPTAPAPTFSVLPPDAPASDPAIEALPVAGFSEPAAPVAQPPEQAKRSRGRPPGAKNKATDFSAPVIAEAPKVSLEFNQVTIAWGATVPTGQFANQRIDVTVGARITGDVEEAIRQVSVQVRKALVSQLESVALSLEGKKLKP